MSRFTLTRFMIRFKPTLQSVRFFATNPESRLAHSSPPPLNNDPSLVHRSIDIRTLNRMEEQRSRVESNGEVKLTDQQDTGMDEVLDANEPVDGSAIVFKDMPLSQVLAKKARFGSAVHAVSEDDKISVAMELMNTLRIGAVLVRPATSSAKHGDEYIGIVSTRDFVRLVTEQGLDPHSSHVSDFMTDSPIFAYADEGAIACLELMQKHGIRHLPIRDSNKRTIGLLSIGDLVRVILAAYRENSAHLMNFISGKYSS
jgi:CBS domain-containing protein